MALHVNNDAGFVLKKNISICKCTGCPLTKVDVFEPFNATPCPLNLKIILIKKLPNWH